jgi:hypothetical protein
MMTGKRRKDGIIVILHRTLVSTLKLDQSSGGKMDPEALCYGSGSMDVREHRRPDPSSSIHQAFSMIILVTVSPLR